MCFIDNPTLDKINLSVREECATVQGGLEYFLLQHHLADYGKQHLCAFLSNVFKIGLPLLQPLHTAQGFAHFLS